MIALLIGLAVGAEPVVLFASNGQLDWPEGLLRSEVAMVHNTATWLAPRGRGRGAAGPRARPPRPPVTRRASGREDDSASDVLSHPDSDRRPRTRT